ncbi:UDP-2,4-diacetamido-2,4,6-trideoxy-beta-L-altropyranose hydrolase [Carboxylicivirga sp. N1Y90]|uniref:UDP-2,4-diacetamido-2,4, 6-trideoxy-beta-L-altropyranose hydrolase n=1 Tax=Carboxylicivirga fragile TaxID=3417571 RepID=UPI003D33F03B|nr:UDP-2,4-diacetamido-2,4,6-trideoxy-beta-L-altropyranose hydrolase [Marinilabiliaceae bacterium N1Y90]
MSKGNIIFRADGGPSIGMGHFVRTLALAEMLKDDFCCTFATIEPTEYQIGEIERICDNRIDLPNNDSHFTLFLEHLKGDEIVVLDNYYFTTEYQRSIKARGCKLVCIDDIHDKHYVADIVINHAEGINPCKFSKEDYTSLLLGYKYALLRSEYLENTSSDNIKKYSCLIMLGGSDPLNITSQIVSTIDNYFFDKPIAVVVSNQNIATEKFKNQYEFFSNISGKQVLNLMRSSNFGFFPASTVSIEACAARLPFICGYFVDNQKEIYQGLLNNNLAECIGDFGELRNESFKNAISKITNVNNHNRIKKLQARFMDGFSINRIKSEFLNII